MLVGRERSGERDRQAQVREEVTKRVTVPIMAIASFNYALTTAGIMVRLFHALFLIFIVTPQCVEHEEKEAQGG